MSKKEEREIADYFLKKMDSLKGKASTAIVHVLISRAR